MFVWHRLQKSKQLCSIGCHCRDLSWRGRICHIFDTWKWNRRSWSGSGHVPYFSWLLFWLPQWDGSWHLYACTGVQWTSPIIYVLRQLLPVFNINTYSFKVALADILEPQTRTASSSLPFSELGIQHTISKLAQNQYTSSHLLQLLTPSSIHPVKKNPHTIRSIVAREFFFWLKETEFSMHLNLFHV